MVAKGKKSSLIAQSMSGDEEKSFFGIDTKCQCHKIDAADK
jgi:hypothetical protein